MIRQTVIVDADVLDAITIHVGRVPSLMKTATTRQIRRAASALRKRLAESEPPEMPTLPFVWSNNPEAQSRARRWYFANKVPRGSAGGRYQRTGALIEAYQVVADVTDRDALITLINTAPGADYVVGDRQVPSHRATDWERLDDVVLDASIELNDRLVQTWLAISVPEL